MSEAAVKQKSAGAGREKIILIVMFAAYAVLTLIGALNHELWFDEAQAWNIARDNDIPGIIAQMAHEGHPFLWFFLLHIFAVLGCTADILPIISWVITSAAVALILWKAPFKPLMKGVIVFSGGFLFYWSVTSRPYCLSILFMVLLAMAYSKRQERPVIFGLLVGLLANTHIMMCGLVGMIGIYMIIDLFKLWKSSPMKENILRLAGLAVAGIGVLALIIPLLGSFGSVNVGNERALDPKMIAELTYMSLADSSCHMIFDSRMNILPSTLSYLVIILFGAVFILMTILLRHYRRAFFMQLLFAVFYVITSEILWISLPVRAFIYLFGFVFCYWIAQSEQPVFRTPKPLGEDLSKPLRASVEWLRRADGNFKRSYLTLLFVYYAATIPAGACVLFADYTQDYSQSKRTADFIRENLPEDSVIVVTTEIFSEYTAYLPGVKFYSINYNEFVSYMFQTKPEKAEYVKDTEDIDFRRVYDDLKDYEHVYILDFAEVPVHGSYEPLYSSEGCLLGSGNPSDEKVSIFPYDVEIEAKPYFEREISD